MFKLFEQCCCQWPDVFEPVCSRAKQDYSERESCQIVLNGGLSIHGHEHIELLLGSREQIAVLDSCPTFPWNGGDGMSD
jgi:hypothetical protein